MKKTLLTLALILLGIGNAHIATASINTFRQGDLGINAGLHLGSLEGNLMTGLALSAEYGIIGDMINGKGSIGVGAELGAGHSHASNKYTESSVEWKEKWNNNIVRIATRGVFHYQFIPQLDTYAGMTFGLCDIVTNHYKLIAADDVQEKSKGTHADFCYGLFAGVRYMFTKNLGLNSELRWDGFSIFSIGLAFKF